jgi:uncharacterized protein (TIGR02270 family)
MAATRPIPWDIYEEHLNEAAWLWGEWEQSLDSAVYALGDVVIGPEDRLLAHLDGLVLGGQPVAQKLLIPALAGDDLGGIAAAAWALVQAEDADHQDTVIQSLASAEPPVQAAIGRALYLSPRADISRLVPLWNTGAPLVRAIVFDIFGPRESGWVREHIEPALCSGQPPLVAAALRAVRNSRDRQFLNHMEFALQSEDADVRLEAMRTGLAMGVKAAWGVCRTFAGALGNLCRFPLGLLATSPDPNDRTFVRGKVVDPEASQHALWALGFTGDVESVEILLQAISDEKNAKIAGEALSAITGIVIAGSLAKPGETQGPDVEEVESDDPPPDVRSEDSLPQPQVEAVKKWWGKACAGIHPGTRYIHGQPRNAETLHTVLTTGATWRREIFAIELGILVKDPPKVDLKGWARDQLKQLGSG